MMTYRTEQHDGYSFFYHEDTDARNPIRCVSARLDGRDESIACINTHHKPGPKWMFTAPSLVRWSFDEGGGSTETIPGLPEGHVLSERVYGREHPDYETALAALHQFIKEEFGL